MIAIYILAIYFFTCFDFTAGLKTRGAHRVLKYQGILLYMAALYCKVEDDKYIVSYTKS